MPLSFRKHVWGDDSITITSQHRHTQRPQLRDDRAGFLNRGGLCSLRRRSLGYPCLVFNGSPRNPPGGEFNKILHSRNDVTRQEGSSSSGAAPPPKTSAFELHGVVGLLAGIDRVAHFPRSCRGKRPVGFFGSPQPHPAGWRPSNRAGYTWRGRRPASRGQDAAFKTRSAAARCFRALSPDQCTMLLARCLGTALLLLLTPTTGCGAAVAAAAAAVSEPDGDIGPACPSSSSSPAGCDSPESDRKATCDDEKACGVREEGESCGVYTPSCALGLRCVPRPGERTPLQALLRGKGICSAPQPKRGGGKNQTETEPVAGKVGGGVGVPRGLANPRWAGFGKPPEGREKRKKNP